MMQYSVNKKIGSVCANIEVHNDKGSEVNLLLDFDINNLRKRVGNFILKQISKMKPEGLMVCWKTKIGEFTIYKESNLDYNWEPYKSKYNTIKTMLEFKPIKGDIKNTVIKSKKIINPEYEGLKKCGSCNTKAICNYKAKRWGEVVDICKKCKQFETILDKLDKKIPLTKSELRSL